MGSVVDRLDGSFELRPKPSAERNMRFVRIMSAALSLGLVVTLAVLGLVTSDRALLYAAPLLVVVSIPVEWVLWRALTPPVIQADPVNVTYAAGFSASTMPRADLSMIFLGQVVQRARYTAWVQSYVFAVAGGKVVFAVPAMWFDRADIEEFAQRLGVPVKGDFTQRVAGSSIDQGTTRG